MFDENEIKKMVEKWSDFSSEIVRECSIKDAHSQAELRLMHELTRFVYKGIYDDEQIECRESVWTLIDAMCGWNLGYLGLPSEKED